MNYRVKYVCLDHSGAPISFVIPLPATDSQTANLPYSINSYTHEYKAIHRNLEKYIIIHTKLNNTNQYTLIQSNTH